MQCEPNVRAMQWRLENDLRELGRFRRELAGSLHDGSRPGGDVDGAVIAASELVTNAISYSDHPVDVTIDWHDAAAVLAVADLGPGFDLGAVTAPAPTAISGRGLMIVSRIVAALRVEPNEPCGSVVIAHLPVQPDGASPGDPVGPLGGAQLAVGGHDGADARDELARFQLRPGGQLAFGLLRR